MKVANQNPIAGAIMSKLLRYEEVKARVGYSRQHLSRLESRGEFPARVRISAKSTRWLESDVDRWIEEKVRGGQGAPHTEPSNETPTTDRSDGDEEPDPRAPFKTKNARLRQQPSVSL